jgi:predicted transcriptional regulator
MSLSNALAENKLLILYTLYHTKLNLTKDQFSNLILESVYLNYFELQQYIEELAKTALITLEQVNGKEQLGITEQGIAVLEMFGDRIKERKRKDIDRYLKENINHLIKETTITHELSEGPHSTFQVTLRAMENKDEILKLEMNFPTKETADQAISNWKDHSTRIYELLYKELIKKI